MKTANLTRGFHRRHHLRTRHRGDTKQFNPVPSDELQDASGRIVLEVPIDDLVLLSSFERSSKREDSERQPSVARPRCAWMIENDHQLTRAV
jgi:hypothetical protein